MSTETSPARVQCCRTRACGWIGTEDEYRWVPNGGPGNSKTAVCPMCGHGEFYMPDRLTDLQKELIEAVGKACAEAGDLPGATTDEVRWHFRRIWGNSSVSRMLQKLSDRGHVLKVPKGRRSKTTWQLPPTTTP